MPRYEKDKLTNLVSHLRTSLSQLKNLGSTKRDRFLADPDKIGSAKYHLIVAIECCIDICNHIISKNGYRVPEDYGDTFAVMAEVGALDKEFAEQLRNMARFRNRLVHLYWQVDDKYIHELLQQRLGDFVEFLHAISHFLGWNNLNLD